jgi:predicted molibdopterin-dependent oxidoreductase YjgC
MHQPEGAEDAALNDPHGHCALFPVNGRTAEVPAVQTVLEAARALGITVPALCSHKDLSAVGACRLCLVEVEGTPLQAAGSLQAANCRPGSPSTFRAGQR